MTSELQFCSMCHIGLILLVMLPVSDDCNLFFGIVLAHRFKTSHNSTLSEKLNKAFHLHRQSVVWYGVNGLLLVVVSAGLFASPGDMFRVKKSL